MSSDAGSPAPIKKETSEPTTPAEDSPKPTCGEPCEPVAECCKKEPCDEKACEEPSVHEESPRPAPKEGGGGGFCGMCCGEAEDEFGQRGLFSISIGGGCSSYYYAPPPPVVVAAPPPVVVRPAPVVVARPAPVVYARRPYYY